MCHRGKSGSHAHFYEKGDILFLTSMAKSPDFARVKSRQLSGCTDAACHLTKSSLLSWPKRCVSSHSTSVAPLPFC